MPTRLAEVQRLLEKYRKAVAAHDNVQLARLADSWVGIERSLSSEMEGLAFQLAEAQANGSAITEQLLMRMERYRGLRSDLRDQIMRLVRGDAPRYISANQTALAKLGLTYSQDMLHVVGAGILFHRLPVGALTTYAGMLGDGTPLFRLLSEAYPYSLDGIIKALLEGTARGLSPRAVAREMANRMGIGLVNITRIARTESMRAFKSSSLEQYRESGVVEGYIRCANKATACLACLALDGEHLDNEENLDDHPNGYCFPVPEVRGAPALDYQNGPDWLAQQDEDKQRQVMGDTRYEMYSDGMPISDMVEMKTDETWGNSPQLVPIGDLEGG